MSEEAAGEAAAVPGWVIRTFGPPLLNPVEVLRLAWYHSEAPWR